MKLTDLDPSFIHRLENWGAYYRDRRSNAQSITAKVCDRAARASGIYPARSQPTERPRIDPEDAQTIEYCWAMCAHRVSATHRALVKAHFVDRADPRMVCRLLHVRWLSWERELCDAVGVFMAAVALLEGADYNPVNNLTPSTDVT